MIVTDTAGNRYIVCDECGHWMKRPVPRCGCPTKCHDMPRRAVERAEKRRRGAAA